MTTIVKTLTAKSTIKKSKNGWFYLLVPCAGFDSSILVKTSRKIEDCEEHYNQLVKAFPNKEY